MTELITIRRSVASFLEIEASPSVLQEIWNVMSYEAENFKWDRRYRAKLWDGRIRMFDPKTRRVHAGLEWRLRAFARDREYDVEADPYPVVIDKDDALEYFKQIILVKPDGTEFHLEDFQIENAMAIIKRKRVQLISPTNSGKTALQYAIVRYLFDRKLVKRFLITTPSVILVNQLAQNFADYAKSDDWPAHEMVGTTRGEEKDPGTPIVIANWQSVQNMTSDFFARFDGFSADESHTVKAKVLRGMLEATTKAWIRFGMTGTNDWPNEMLIEGLTGPVHKSVTNADLIARGFSSAFRIRPVILRYQDEDKEQLKKVLSVITGDEDAKKRKRYAAEVSFLTHHDRRNRFVTQLCGKFKSGNTLIVSNREEQWTQVAEKLRAAYPDRKVYVIDGGVDESERERIRKAINNDVGAFVVVSLQTFSTGVDVPELHNMVWLCVMKAEKTVLQTIGRMLRKSKTGEGGTMYDITDDLRTKKYDNYSYRHAENRLTSYVSEGYPVEPVEIFLGQKRD